ncbi:M23 family metallopeptidase [Demequina sp. NBRC 110051]|uniref:M23 family metallopeptidase n=1 Tax=Demequina sp. NBRC 110051 TaxID=1570340 RepID=UPI000A053601|nr:M23 family metallopeptidase [Demequina sp. NBRC 110051]
MPVALARLRVPALYVGVLLVVVGIAIEIAAAFALDVPQFGAALGEIGAVVWCVAMLTAVMAPGARVEAAVCGAPVRGMWMVRRSPATRRPSHGTHTWARTYGVDFVYGTGKGDVGGHVAGGFSRPGRYLGFGQPVYSPVDGIVVHVTDGVRDHRARTSFWGRAWYLIECPVRSLGGPRAVFGNHVVIRLTDGTHVLIAHLRRGSLRVQQGDGVSAGALVAACGNSGSSAKPHVHVHRQDLASPYVAMGLPWALEGRGIPRVGDDVGVRVTL